MNSQNSSGSAQQLLAFIPSRPSYEPLFTQEIYEHTVSRDKNNLRLIKMQIEKEELQMLKINQRRVQQLVDAGQLTVQDVEELRKWAQENRPPEVPELIPEQIARFFLACSKDHERTQIAIRTNYKIRRETPEIFKNRNVQSKGVQTAATVMELSKLPETTPEGYTLCFGRLVDPVYTHVDMEQCLKLVAMSLDADMRECPLPGVIVLLDMHCLGVMHLTRLKFGLLKPIFQYIQNGLNFKLIEVHIFNSVYFLDKIMAILTPYLNSELLHKLHFHPPKMDMEEFYEKYIPKRCLPEDYGGDLPSMASFHADNIKRLEGMQSYFDAEEAQRIAATEPF